MMFSVVVARFPLITVSCNDTLWKGEALIVEMLMHCGASSPKLTFLQVETNASVKQSQTLSTSTDGPAPQALDRKKQ